MSDTGSDDIWKRAEAQSPCIKLCVTHPESGLCMGCYRTLEEIARWPGMTPDERRAVMMTLPERAPQVRGRRRGGRSGRTG